MYQNKIIWAIATKNFYTFPNKKTNNEKDKKNILTWQILNPTLLDYLDDLYVFNNIAYI